VIGLPGVAAGLFKPVLSRAVSWLRGQSARRARQQQLHMARHEYDFKLQSVASPLVSDRLALEQERFDLRHYSSAGPRSRGAEWQTT
jgi:hypothetical protein